MGFYRKIRIFLSGRVENIEVVLVVNLFIGKNLSVKKIFCQFQLGILDFVFFYKLDEVLNFGILVKVEGFEYFIR